MYPALPPGDSDTCKHLRTAFLTHQEINEKALPAVCISQLHIYIEGNNHREGQRTIPPTLRQNYCTVSIGFIITRKTYGISNSSQTPIENVKFPFFQFTSTLAKTADLFGVGSEGYLFYILMEVYFSRDLIFPLN